MHNFHWKLYYVFICNHILHIVYVFIYYVIIYYKFYIEHSITSKNYFCKWIYTLFNLLYFQYSEFYIDNRIILEIIEQLIEWFCQKIKLIELILLFVEWNSIELLLYESYRVVRIIIEVSVIWTENHFTYEYLYR